MPSAYNSEMEFHEENMDKKSFTDSYYFNLTPDEQLRFNAFASRFAKSYDGHGHIPPEYKNIVRQNNKTWNSTRLNADPSLMTDESTYEVIQYLARTWYEQQPMAQVLAPVTTTLTKPAWMIKWYTVNDAEYPEFTAGGPSAFRGVEAFHLGLEPSTSSGVGAALRYDISWTLRKEANGIYDPEQWHQLEGMKKFGVLWDERLCLGTACEHTSGDLGITGLYNATGLLTEPVGIGTDNDLTATGDVDAMIYQFLGDMRTFKEPGYNVLVTTSGIASEVFLHDATTDRTEYEKLYNKWFASGMVGRWVVDDNIYSGTPGTATQYAMMFRLSEHSLRRVIAYPFQKKPIANVEFSDDIAFLFLTADILTFTNTSSAKGTYARLSASANVVTTVAGFVRNGIFMEGKRVEGVPPVNPPKPSFYPYGMTS